jgi:hypothetical protein
MRLIRHKLRAKEDIPFLGIRKGKVIRVATMYTPCKIYHPSTYKDCPGCLDLRELQNMGHRGWGEYRSYQDEMQPHDHICVSTLGGDYFFDIG